MTWTRGKFLPNPFKIRVICGLRSSARLVAQLDVPVSEIDKVSPAFVLRRRKCNVYKRPPLWPFRLPNQCHVHFLGEPVAFARVTFDARANHVFPTSRSAAVARDDVVKIQIAAIESVTAVLTGVLVTLENVMPRKFHLLLRKPIEKEQHNHARHTDLP